MKLMTVTLLVTLGSLAACGKKSETNAPPTASGAENQTDAMAGMTPTSQVGKMVTGSGTVTAVDSKAGTITLDHDAIPDTSWTSAQPCWTAVMMSQTRTASPILVLKDVSIGVKPEPLQYWTQAFDPQRDICFSAGSRSAPIGTPLHTA